MTNKLRIKKLPFCISLFIILFMFSATLIAAETAKNRSREEMTAEHEDFFAVFRTVEQMTFETPEEKITTIKRLLAKQLRPHFDMAESIQRADLDMNTAAGPLLWVDGHLLHRKSTNHNDFLPSSISHIRIVGGVLMEGRLRFTAFFSTRWDDDYWLHIAAYVGFIFPSDYGTRRQYGESS